MSFVLDNRLKTLVIPDLHLRHETAEKVIAALKPEQVIFLGDYFDDYGDTVALNEAAAEWLKHSVRQPHRYHLWGNHDLHYAFRWRDIRGTGHTPAKSEAINKILAGSWSKLDFFATWHPQKHRPWLISHSGLHADLAPFRLRHNWPSQLKWLEAEEAKANHDLRNVGSTWITRPGYARGGCSAQQYGGLVWGDWHNFDGPAGIHQMLGHTPLSAPETLDRGNRRLVCLDTWSYCKDGNDPHVAILAADGTVGLIRVKAIV